MNHPTNSRLEWAVGCLVTVALVTACLLACLCSAGGIAWQAAMWPLPTPTVTSQPLDDETTSRHLRVFTRLWNIVNDDYLYPDYNGADWEAIGRQYRARVAAGMSDQDFWWTMDDMLLELHDDHSIFLSPAQATSEDQELNGEFEYVGIGVYAVPLPEKEYVVVLLTLPNSPAARAGIRPHDHILSIDGTPTCCDKHGYNNLDLLLGPAGSKAELRVQAVDGPVRTVSVTRELVLESLPVETRRLEGNVGYILIPTLWDETTVEHVQQALDELSAGGDLDGLVLDMRVNGGGSDIVLKGLLALFADGELGHFVSGQEERPLRVDGVDVHGSQRIPLVILVGRETASFAEIFSGVLQEAGRAQIVGRTTPGNVEITYGYDFEDGSRAWIAQESFRPPSGTDWEQTGIVPEVEIPLGWDEFTTEDDPQLETALDLLRP